MNRRIISVILAIALIVSLSVPAFAETRAVNVNPTMYFSGGRVYCSADITAAFQEIDAELQLWRGSNLVASWSGNGISSIVISGNHAVTSGRTYTVTVTGTIDGKAFTSNSVSATCP